MVLQKTATLKTIFSDVLANLAFMFTDDAQSEAAPGQVWLETVIEYEGPVRGLLRFRCTREFAVMLASNLLGTDPDSEDALQQDEDAVKEFMNIVCGQFVTAMHGTDDIYNLTIPRTTQLSEAPDLIDDGGLTACTFCVDSQVIQLMYEPQPTGS